MFGKPECDVLQPEPHSGEAGNTLSHMGLTNVNIQKGMLYCHCYIYSEKQLKDIWIQFHLKHSIQ